MLIAAILVLSSGVTGLRIGLPVHAATTRTPLKVRARVGVLHCSEGQPKRLSAAEVVQVGELVADDEWNGLGMELSAACLAVAKEQLKSLDSTVEITKELDEKIKAQVAQMRGKDEYQVGDLSELLDAAVKAELCKVTGKPEYELGDLTVAIDERVKAAAARYCGKEEYEVGDLSQELDRKIKERVNSFTGNDAYEFGDITREVLRRREEWVSEMQEVFWADDYQSCSWSNT